MAYFYSTLFVSIMMLTANAQLGALLPDTLYGITRPLITRLLGREGKIVNIPYYEPFNLPRNQQVTAVLSPKKERNKRNEQPNIQPKAFGTYSLSYYPQYVQYATPLYYQQPLYQYQSYAPQAGLLGYNGAVTQLVTAPLQLILHSAEPDSMILHSRSEVPNTMRVSPIFRPNSKLPSNVYPLPTGQNFDGPVGFNLQQAASQNRVDTTHFSPEINVPKGVTPGMMRRGEDGLYTEVPALYDNETKRVVGDLGSNPEGDYVYTYKFPTA